MAFGEPGVLPLAFNIEIGPPKPIAMNPTAIHDAKNLKNNGGNPLGCDQMKMSNPRPMNPNIDMKISANSGGRWLGVFMVGLVGRSRLTKRVTT
ncbi:MAG: hypothetical protein RLY20_1726 [Verrucomicrobiota bacterium]